MAIVRIWQKKAEDAIFVAESEVLIDPEGVGHILCDDEQLLILRDRINEVLEGREDGGKEDQDRGGQWPTEDRSA